MVACWVACATSSSSRGVPPRPAFVTAMGISFDQLYLLSTASLLTSHKDIAAKDLPMFITICFSHHWGCRCQNHGRCSNCSIHVLTLHLLLPSLGLPRHTITGSLPNFPSGPGAHEAQNGRFRRKFSLCMITYEFIELFRFFTLILGSF